MKNVIITIVSFFFLVSCNNIDYKPKYKDFLNDWERENLIGKVKKLEQYKANVTDSEIDKPIIQFKKEFTKNGNISYKEHFDSFGTLEQYVKNTYDKNDFRIESISENLVKPMKLTEQFTFDTITKKQISSHIIYNDSATFNILFKYNQNGDLTEQISILNADTTVNKFEYKYHNDRQILFKKQIDNNENEYTNEFKYDSKGNLVELIYKSPFFLGERKSIYTYDSKNNIIKITEYKSEQIEKETSFDKFYNKVLVRFYKNNTPHREIQYKYKFNSTGDWIKRTAFIKEFLGEKKTTPIFVETRKIEYYQ